MKVKPEKLLLYRSEKVLTQARDGAVKVQSMRSSSNGRIRIGVSDLDACAGALPLLLSTLESAQDRFSFFSVEAALQTGLTFPGRHVAQEWLASTHTAMPDSAAATNVSSQRIFKAAKPVLKSLPVEWLVLIVRSMISDVSGTEPTHNLFSTTSGKIALVSTFGLRDYAAKAGRPFEAAVFQSVLSTILAMMVPKVGYMEETTGSIFDYCEKRADIVRSIRNPHIDPDNRKVIPARLLGPAEKLLGALGAYEGRVVEPGKASAIKAAAIKNPRVDFSVDRAGSDKRSFTDVLSSLKSFAKK
jgi:hypothetical protein